MTRSKLEKLITDFVIQHNLDASFVQQTEGLTYVRFVVEEDFQEGLNQCPLVVTDYQDFTDLFQITFSLNAD